MEILGSFSEIIFSGIIVRSSDQLEDHLEERICGEL